jgi:hypothetical protein
MGIDLHHGVLQQGLRSDLQSARWGFDGDHERIMLGIARLYPTKKYGMGYKWDNKQMG